MTSSLITLTWSLTATATISQRQALATELAAAIPRRPRLSRFVAVAVADNDQVNVVLLGRRF